MKLIKEMFPDLNAQQIALEFQDVFKLLQDKSLDSSQIQQAIATLIQNGPPGYPYKRIVDLFGKVLSWKEKENAQQNRPPNNVQHQHLKHKTELSPPFKAMQEVLHRYTQANSGIRSEEKKLKMGSSYGGSIASRIAFKR